MKEYRTKLRMFQAPLINSQQYERVGELVHDASVKGANVVSLGNPQEGENSLRFSPTVLTNVNTEMRVFKEEIFGPVLPVMSFNTEEVSEENK